MKKGYTHIGVLLDRSGSMAHFATDTKGGFDAFIKEQQKVEGKATLSLYQFDHEFQTVHYGLPLDRVPPLIFEPRGSTALLDGMARSITLTGTYLKDMMEKDRPEKVVFVIITDGEENASKEFTLEKVKEMVKHQTDVYQWEFVYLGASPDSISVAASMNIGVANAAVYNPKNIGSTYRNFSSNLSGTRSGTKDDMNWTVAQREDLTSSSEKK